MANDLEGKVILLTGGASGIGRECALTYAREGTTIAILDRSFEEADVIADAAVFLLSAKARFITGCILPVSGGAELGYRR